MNGRRGHDPILGLTVLACGLFLAVCGIAWGWGCDFDSMGDCHPLGLVTLNAFSVEGTAGLLFLPGAGLMIAGVAMTIAGLLWPRAR